MEENCPACRKKEVDLSPEAVAAIVDQIPILPELKVSEEVLGRRLAVCYDCDALREGVICAFCGCFISFRTRSNKQYCPHPAGEKWPAA
ncbi:MAG: DUF6171 family protein [Treponema sp.]|jgi:hypothetical protein|nr:DUF6171 family protein [Treponema sp.]